jgi:hypothetical protein
MIEPVGPALVNLNGIQAQTGRIPKLNPDTDHVMYDQVLILN